MNASLKNIWRTNAAIQNTTLATICCCLFRTLAKWSFMSLTNQILLQLPKNYISMSWSNQNLYKAIRFITICWKLPSLSGKKKNIFTNIFWLHLFHAGQNFCVEIYKHKSAILGGESRLESRRLLSYQYIYADITFMWVEHWDWKITVWVDIILNLSCDNFWYLDFVNNKWERRNKPGVSTDKGVQAEGSWGDLRQEEREQRGVDFREQQQDLQHQQRREWGTREWWVGKSILPYLWKSNTK